LHATKEEVFVASKNAKLELMLQQVQVVVFLAFFKMLYFE
jgi:hypothetical protein